MIEFTVYGQPVTQGSKVAHALYGKDGKPRMKGGRVITVARENKKLAPWRNQVSAAAAETYTGELLTCPIYLEITFTKPRPANHFGTGRNAGVLKQSAPEYPTTRPDTLKLARAIEDALSGVIWKDDSQVVVHQLYKQYGERYETHVLIERMVANK